MANRYPLQQPQMQPRIDMTMRNNVPTGYPRPRAGMWPHQQMVDEQNEKQREYLKQQQKLRLMAGTSAPVSLKKAILIQSVSADALIENLLGKKDTFKPKTTHHTVQPGAATSSPLMLATAAPGMVPPHVAPGSVRPVMGYPLPSPSTSSAMISGYGSPGLPSEAKPTTSRMDVNMSSQAQFALNLPAWLTPTSPHFPQFYRQVWKMVGQEKGLVDTTRIFPLLLTSGLPTDVLGFIWGLANRKVAGQLTEQELYIVLALVALAQSGCTFNNLGILNLIPQPPIPNLKLNGFESVGSAPVRDPENAVSSQGKMKREDLNLGHMSSVPSQSTPAPEPDDAGFDEFTDFQSATAVIPEPSSITNSKDPVPISRPEGPISVSTVSPNVIPHLSPPSSALEVADNLAAKCPSVMVVSSGHGRGIGSRLANHSLGAPKQKKSKHHHHHHHHLHRSQPQSMSSNPISVDDDFSDFQQAKEPIASTEDNFEAFQRCTVKPIPQGKTYLLKESAIRSEVRIDPPQLQPPEAVKIPSIVPPVGDKDEKEEKSNSDPQNVPSVFENKTTTSKDTKTEGVNLMAVEEDKYSALRNLVLTDQDATPEKPQAFPSMEASPASDEFGDFLSADPVQAIDDSFADIAAREQTPSVNILDVGSPDMWNTAEAPQTVEFQVDDWGDFQDSPLPENNTRAPAAIEENELGALDTAKLEADISAAFMTLDLGSEMSWNQGDSAPHVSGLEKDKLQFFPSLSDQSTDLNLGGTWDVKVKDENSGEGDKHFNATENAQQSGPFQGFLGKIYDGIKLENDFTKDDIFGSVSGNQRSSNFDSDIQIHTRDHGSGDDDFGDFVGPDAWAEDQKYSAAAKDMLFDGHLGAALKDGLYGDSQSVSSLELPPLALSRHGSVPSLDLKIFPSSAEKNGGNGGNQPWDINISSEEVLDEVVGSAEGKDYLQNLVEVAGVTQRVESSYKQLASGGEYKKLDSLLADIDSAWTSLEQYYLKADISVSGQTTINWYNQKKP
ncbi:hypothetical protein C0J52_16280 [Blattella germanica]|nr:hypothetical protein C0J52_16280 [Blattella germanica]